MKRRSFRFAVVVCGLSCLVPISRAVVASDSPSSGDPVLVDEQFSEPKMDARLRWLNPPPLSEAREGWLVVAPGDQTDFWQKTLDGGSRDNGHFLYLELSGDFLAETKLTGDYLNLYDQAGMMLRKDATHWLKVDAENDPVGSPTLGVVITRETSDWSVSRLAPKETYFQLSKKGALVEVRTSEDGRNWSYLRMVTLDWSDPVQVGLFAACPTKAGMRVRFDYLKITRPAK